MAETSRKPLSNNTKAIIFGIFLLLAFIAWGRQDSAEPTSDGASRTDAWMACKDAVKDQVRNPATADFSIMSTTIDEAASGGYDIAGSLTAKNDFGVEKEIAFSCQVDASGSATANLAPSN